MNTDMSYECTNLSHEYHSSYKQSRCFDCSVFQVSPASRELGNAFYLLVLHSFARSRGLSG